MTNDQTEQQGRKGPRQHYDKHLRRRAVELWEASGKSAPQVAAELGILPNRLYAWRAALKPVAPANPAGAAALSPEVLAQENAQLRQEIAHLRQQRDILKKTLGILSESPSNGINGSKP